MSAGSLASMVANPDHHQTCVVVPGVEVCVFERYTILADRVLGEVAPVVAALPDDVGTITLRQVFNGEIDVLGPEVAETLDGRTPTTGFLQVAFLNNDDAMTAAQFTVALDAVGLPVEPVPATSRSSSPARRAGSSPCGSPPGGVDVEDAYALIQTAQEVGTPWPDPCTSGSSPPVTWSRKDLLATRALLSLPASDVESTIVANWEQLADPSTTTDDLLTMAGLDPIGPPERVAAIPVVCTWY